MDFKGAGIKATEADIAAIAADLGVPYFRLRGVIEVEAPRGPFDKRGRPTMLFEPYQFWKRLPASKRKAAVEAGVAKSRRPKRGGYPADSYPVLAKAMAFDQAIALQCCSWGRGQVMGFNFKIAGYSDVFEMVEAAKASEAEQLRAMANFIKSAGLLPHLKSGDAENFAAGYNGAGYARDGYDVKIKAAWAKWETRPVPRSGAAAPAPRPKPAPVVYTDKATVERVQARLWELGYTEVGDVDGRLGTYTWGAIRTFRAENDLPAGQHIDDAMLAALLKAPPRAIAPARADAKPEDIRATVPEGKQAWLTKIVSGVTAWLTGLFAFITGLLEYIAPARSYIAPVREALGDVPSWVWVAAIFAVAVTLYRIARKGEREIIYAVQTGARR